MAFVCKKDFTGASREEMLKSASDRIFRSVSVSEQSSIKMRAKLEAVGYPVDIIDEAIDKAVSIGAIDDTRYCECLIRSTVSAGKGLGFAQREIESLGIDIESLEAYQDYLERGEEAQIDDALDFLSRHTSKAKNLHDSCYRKLRMRGFSHSVASKATRNFIDSMMQE